jgi:hypothetical protein
MIVPNKAPAALLPILKPTERRFALGMENILIAEK